MKMFLVIFTVIVATNTSPTLSVDNDNLNAVAKDLVNKISALSNNINVVRKAIEKAPQELNENIKSIDFRLPKNQQILEIQKKLSSYTSNNNLDSCRNLFEEKSKALKEELQKILSKSVAVQLVDIIIGLKYVEQELSSISANLQGESLDDEITLCRNGDSEDSTCNLTGKYATQIWQNEKVIENFSNTVRLVVEKMLLLEVNSKVPDKVKSIVYEPVLECLEKL